jgi:hypothetical protein
MIKTKKDRASISFGRVSMACKRSQIVATVRTSASNTKRPEPGYIGDRPHGYYDYYGGGGHATWNGCRPGWTVQGGVCKPYRYGAWDYAPHYRHWYR